MSGVQGTEASGHRSICQAKDWLAASAVGIATFILYVKTLAPTVTGEDSGELIAAAYTMGISHPPGYPLWCLLGKLFTFIPVGDIAYRCNLMSAFFGALCCSFVFLITVSVTSQRLIAAVAALLFAASKEFWSQSLIAEVYTLNLFFTLAVLYLLLLWKNRRESRLLSAAAILFGLSLTNHYWLSWLTTATASAVFLGYEYGLFETMLRPLRRWTGTLLYAAMSGLPLLVYLYLPLRASQNPPMNWGNPDSWHSFWSHVTRASYRSLELETSVLPNIKLLFTLYFVGQWIQQFTWILFPVLIVGFVWLLRNRPDLAYASATLVLFNSLVLIVGLKFTFEGENLQRFRPYFLPAYAMSTVWLGCGLMSVREWLAKKWSAWSRSKDQLKRPVTRGAFLLRPALLFLILVPLSAHWAENDMSNNYLAYDTSLVSLETVKKGAILFPSGDYRSFPLAYLTMVEGKRNDVIVADVYGTLHYDVLKLYRQLTKDKALRTKTEIESAIIRKGKRPVYYSMKGDFPDVEGYTLRPDGLWFRVAKIGEKEKPVTAHAPPQPTLAGSQPPSADFEKDARHSTDPNRAPEIPGLPKLPGHQHGLPNLPLPKLPSHPEVPGAPKASQVSDLPGLMSTRWLKRIVRGAENPSPHLDEMSLSCVTDYWFFKGQHHFRRGEVEEGLNAFATVAQLAKNNKETLNNLGSAYAEQGLADRAAAMYQQAINLYPDYAMAHHNLGRLYENADNKEAAIGEYQEALRIDSRLDAVRERLVELSPKTLKTGIHDSANSHVDLGCLYEKAGKRDAAIAEYQQALRIDPRLGDVRNRLVKLQSSR